MTFDTEVDPEIRSAAESLEELILSRSGDCGERADALTKLQEVVVLASKGAEYKARMEPTAPKEEEGDDDAPKASRSRRRSSET